MATAMTKPRMSRVDDDEDEQQQHRLRPVDDCDHGVVAREVSIKRVSCLAVEGGGGGGGSVVRRSAKLEDDDAAAVHERCLSGVGGERTTLPPPHAWLAVEDANKMHRDHGDPEEQWMRLLHGGGGGRQQQSQQRRSSFSVVRRERAAREVCLDRAWEMKRSWHERNGGAPDANTPVVVVVGGKEPPSASSSWEASSHHHAGGGGVAMDVEEVRACRDLGLELPSDCTVEIQCYGLPAAGGDSSPTHTAAASSSGADDDFSCAGAVSSPGADPMDVKARLKVWAHAVALTSTTQLSPP